MPDPATASQPPRVVGRYAIHAPIASGGMATVHLGRLLGPVGFSRTVAIKCLHPQFAEDPTFVTMLLDEARVAGRIRHPNCVATLDVIAEGREVLLVMDYVHGESLARVLRDVSERREAFPLPIALRIASDVLLGLHAAHETCDEDGNPLHIIHRDVSPQNILIGVDGITRIVDFGVAKAAGRAQSTFQGQLKGKLAYMSPEQLQGNDLTRRVDIHAFAIVLWEMLAGRRLFLGSGEADTVARVIEHHVPRLAGPGSHLPPAVDAVIGKGLAEDPTARYATAREMCVALDSCGAIASTMQLADWLRREMGPWIDERTKLLRSIERRESARSAPARGEPTARAEASLPGRASEPRPTGAPPAALGSPTLALDEEVVLPTSSLAPRILSVLGVVVALGALWHVGAWLARVRSTANPPLAEGEALRRLEGTPPSPSSSATPPPMVRATTPLPSMAPRPERRSPAN